MRALNTSEVQELMQFLNTEIDKYLMYSKASDDNEDYIASAQEMSMAVAYAKVKEFIEDKIKP